VSRENDSANKRSSSERRKRTEDKGEEEYCASEKDTVWEEESIKKKIQLLLW